MIIEVNIKMKKMKKIMKKILLFALLLLSIFSLYCYEFIEVVYLKNGSIIRGLIIEQQPNVLIKIQTKDGSIFVYKMDEVEKIT